MKLELSIHARQGAFELNIDACLDGSVWGVFGPSGAGKTSVLDAVAGLTRPDHGAITLDGDVLYQRQSGRRAQSVPVHRRGVGYVFQDARLLPHLGVEGNLRYAEKRTPRSRRRFHRDDIIDLLKLRPLLGRNVGQLSGGERQRVAIGRALLTSPRLLLLDEPMTGLDAGHARDILAYLRRISRELGVAMLIVSHDLRDILALTDRLLLIEGGRNIAAGPLTDLASDPACLQRLHASGLSNVLEFCVNVPAGSDGMSTLAPPERPLCQTTGRPVQVVGPAWEDVRKGDRVVVSLRPEDIALARGPVEYISVQNQLRGRIRHITRSDQAVICRVDAGVDMLVEVTPAAAAEMNLTVGQSTWVLFKARALQRLAIAEATPGDSSAPLSEHPSTASAWATRRPGVPAGSPPPCEACSARP